MEYVTLNNGVKMPVLGYGTYQTPSDRMKENFEVLNFELTSEEIQGIEGLEIGKSLFGWW